jgi:glutaminyl-tRNA synthetase
MQIIDADNQSGKWGVWSAGDAGEGAVGAARLGKPRVHTRFPPEPNGYLHIGHAKAICLNFGLAVKYGGKFNLRFDDTNPAKEEQEFVDAIKDDVMWLGADFEGEFGGGTLWASDYFEQMYLYAEELVKKGKAYVCDMTAEEVSKNRGTPSIPSKSFFRDRAIDENLRLLREMRGGQHATGTRTLRAKIDLTSPNFNLRDPVMYRILHEEHHNTGRTWCIYPMYDWAHGLEDSIERITHSICTLEFENHRPLYDWFIRELGIYHPQQVEFSRLNLTYTVMSKRFLLSLVKEGKVNGWDDPRMPTIRAIRRRGYPAEAIRAFCEDVGVTRTESLIDVTRLENACRDHLNRTAPRAMAVLRPLRVVIDNWEAGRVDELDAQNNPEDASAGARKVPFTREIFIERDDFQEEPAKKFFRLAPGREVRLRWAYYLTCTGVEKDASGNVTLLRATIDPATRGGDSPDGRKVKATMHWVSAERCVNAEVRLFDRLFSAEVPGKRTGNMMDDLNPGALEMVRAKLEPSLAGAGVGYTWQFERLGYFCVDRDSAPGKLVFNRTVTLKDSWAKASQDAKA